MCAFTRLRTTQRTALQALRFPEFIAVCRGRTSSPVQSTLTLNSVVFKKAERWARRQDGINEGIGKRWRKRKRDKVRERKRESEGWSKRVRE